MEAGAVRPTVTSDLGPISAESLRRAHAAVESGRTVGKIVLEGWPT